MQVFQQATHDSGFALEASNVMGESYFYHVKCHFGNFMMKDTQIEKTIKL